ncbi:hypothetical protein GQ55_2G067800 [Panicum hallii var. hallii]|uniref:Uncharacterized protein n=1 Tax=Panicum hallii var. hallii TaxID=1504633 RepID=A0A2T7EM78_9POAL|nr:hypothetical protein GQ55_2G067800 [Panicum hallii var. hallii]
MDICRLVFAPSGIFKTIGSIEPCKTHHKKGCILEQKYFTLFFCCKCIIMAAAKGKGWLLISSFSLWWSDDACRSKSLFMSSFIKLITNCILTISSDFNFLTCIYFFSPYF